MLKWYHAARTECYTRTNREWQNNVSITFKYISVVFIKCAVPESIHPPTMEGSFALDPHPLEFPWDCLSYAPTTTTSNFFQLGWVPSGKNVSIKNVVALYYYAKDNLFLE